MKEDSDQRPRIRVRDFGALRNMNEFDQVTTEELLNTDINELFNPPFSNEVVSLAPPSTSYCDVAKSRPEAGKPTSRQPDKRNIQPPRSDTAGYSIPAGSSEDQPLPLIISSTFSLGTKPTNIPNAPQDQVTSYVSPKTVPGTTNALKKSIEDGWVSLIRKGASHLKVQSPRMQTINAELQLRTDLATPSIGSYKSPLPPKNSTSNSLGNTTAMQSSGFMTSNLEINNRPSTSSQFGMENVMQNAAIDGNVFNNLQNHTRPSVLTQNTITIANAQTKVSSPMYVKGPDDLFYQVINVTPSVRQNGNESSVIVPNNSISYSNNDNRVFGFPAQQRPYAQAQIQNNVPVQQIQAFATQVNTMKNNINQVRPMQSGAIAIPASQPMNVSPNVYSMNVRPTISGPKANPQQAQPTNSGRKVYSGARTKDPNICPRNLSTKCQIFTITQPQKPEKDHSTLLRNPEPGPSILPQNPESVPIPRSYDSWELDFRNKLMKPISGGTTSFKKPETLNGMHQRASSLKKVLRYKTYTSNGYLLRECSIPLQKLDLNIRSNIIKSPQSLMAGARVFSSSRNTAERMASNVEGRRSDLGTTTTTGVHHKLTTSINSRNVKTGWKIRPPKSEKSLKSYQKMQGARTKQDNHIVEQSGVPDVMIGLDNPNIILSSGRGHFVQENNAQIEISAMGPKSIHSTKDGTTSLTRKVTAPVGNVVVKQEVDSLEAALIAITSQPTVLTHVVSGNNSVISLPTPNISASPVPVVGAAPETVSLSTSVPPRKLSPCETPPLSDLRILSQTKSESLLKPKHAITSANHIIAPVPPMRPSGSVALKTSRSALKLPVEKSINAIKTVTVSTKPGVPETERPTDALLESTRDSSGLTLASVTTGTALVSRSDSPELLLQAFQTRRSSHESCDFRMTKMNHAEPRKGSSSPRNLSILQGSKTTHSTLESRNDLPGFSQPLQMSNDTEPRKGPSPPELSSSALQGNLMNHIPFWSGNHSPEFSQAPQMSRTNVAEPRKASTSPGLSRAPASIANDPPLEPRKGSYEFSQAHQTLLKRPHGLTLAPQMSRANNAERRKGSSSTEFSSVLQPSMTTDPNFESSKNLPESSLADVELRRDLSGFSRALQAPRTIDVPLKPRTETPPKTCNEINKIFELFEKKPNFLCSKCDRIMPTAAFWVNVLSQELLCQPCVSAGRQAGAASLKRTVREIVRELQKAVRDSSTDSEEDEDNRNQMEKRMTRAARIARRLRRSERTMRKTKVSDGRNDPRIPKRRRINIISSSVSESSDDYF